MSTSALRAWEERYGVLEPRRSDGGHRQYSEDDVARVMAVRALVAAGHTVAAAAAELTGPVGSGAVRYSSLAAVYAATRAVLASEHSEEVIAAVDAFVRTVGARPVAASEDPANAIPLDIALGEGPPVLPVA